MSSNNNWISLTLDRSYNNDNSYELPYDYYETCNINLNNVTNCDDFDMYDGKTAIKIYNENSQDNIDIDINKYKKLYKIELYKHKLFNLMLTVLKINIKKLNKYEDIPEKEFIKQTCIYDLHYKNYDNEENKIYFNSNYRKKIFFIKKEQILIKDILEPANYINDLKIEQPSWLKLNLYNYQKANIKWMVDKEYNYQKIHYYNYPVIKLGKYGYNTANNQFDILNNIKKYSFIKGGALIDEVGLGKTIQMITLSLLNPCTNKKLISKKNKKINSRATLIICPNQLCGQWSREFKKTVSKNKKLKIIIILSKLHYEKYTYNDIINADFVILSFNFLNNDVYKNNWYYLIDNNKEHKREWKLKWDNFYHDKINFFNSKFNDNLFANDFLNLNKPLFHLIIWHRIIVDEFHELYVNHKYIYLSNLLPHFKSKYRWIISATPFMDNFLLTNIFKFITNDINISYNVYYDDEINNHLLSSFRRNTKLSVQKENLLPDIIETVKFLDFSNTEQLIYNAYLQNPLNDKSDIYLRQLCCHPLIADKTKSLLKNCKTLDDIEKMMIVHYKNEIDICTNKINKINNKISAIDDRIKQKKLYNKQKKLSNKISVDSIPDDFNLDDDNIDISKISLNKLHEMKNNYIIKLNDLNTILKGKQSTYNYYISVVDKLNKTIETFDKNNKSTNDDEIDFSNIDFNNISDSDDDSDNDSDNDDNNNGESCGICMSKIKKFELTVTKCGHIFCRTCIQTSINTNNKCPYCKTHLTLSDFYIISSNNNNNVNNTNNTNNFDNSTLDNLIKNVGTKLAHVIQYIKQTDEHMIIFSQWNDLLKKIGSILNQYNIKNIFCKGSCFQRDKAIRSFNENDDIKIIMLSSDSNAAGTNLTKASTILFLDPLYGSLDYRLKQKKQAVGRVHRLGQTKNVKVIHFIIKNSIEEEMFNSSS